MVKAEKNWTTGTLSLRDNSFNGVDLDEDTVSQLFGFLKKVTNVIDHRGPVGNGSGVNGSVNSSCITSVQTRASNQNVNLSF